MCVILIADDKRLTGRMIRRANAKIPDGLGMAWFDGKVSHYVKDIPLKRAIKLSKKVPLPYVLHARYATEGGVDPALCHPFPITKRRSERTEGRCPRLLFQNGHWGEWEETLKRIENRGGVKCPEGPMSDSRAMAFIVATVGEGVLDMQHGQKFAMMERGVVYRYGKGWVKWNGFWCSNTRWVPRPKSPIKGSTLFTQQGFPALRASAQTPVVDRRRGKPQPAQAQEPLGFYTVPGENGAAMLVKARSTSEAFQIAAGHAPVWRRQMASSENPEEEVQTLEAWMKKANHTNTWRQPLINIDPD